MLGAMRSVKELIEAAGGAEAIARYSGDISEYAPLKWPQIGIPEKHWGTMAALAQASVEELYAANKVARERA